MKQGIVKIMSRYFYPQTIFAKSILKHIKSTTVNQLLIDAPCGNGETSWHFSTKKNISVFGYDLDAVSVKNAKENYKTNNLKFEEQNIVDVIKMGKYPDYFCIINSLFLLPEPEKILKQLSVSIKQNGLLFIIVPNVEGENFKWFNNRNQGLNKLVLNRNQFETYFKENGFVVTNIEPIVYTHNYGRKDVKLFSIFSHLYLSFLNYFQTKFSIGVPNYYLIVSTSLN